MFTYHLTILIGSISLATSLPQIGRIYGGEDAKIEDVPYQVSVQLKGRHYCGGAIISENWVLTAAHCIDSPWNQYSIRAGSQYSYVDGTVYDIDRIKTHENYAEAWGIPTYDIALIRVSSPFKLDRRTKPIEMFNKNDEVLEGSDSIVSGWGSTGKLFSRHQLQKASIPTITKEKCKELYTEYFDIPEEGMICAAHIDGGIDSCQGDSGGPMVVNNRLAGVISWGIGCAIAGNPGVYTEVAYFRDWIHQHSKI